MKKNQLQYLDAFRALNIETGEVGRVNPRSKSNSFNFTVPGQKAKSVNMSKLKVVHKKDGYIYNSILSTVVDKC
ncbi:hypothetical protein CYANOKiyG1_55520 [Okeania sp. KiyG1]|nr:hypothetical protein CYANOKiyG1_55520 [Okeania sp. KiyG1]